MQVALSLAGVTGKWSKEETENTLSDITLNIKYWEAAKKISGIFSGRTMVTPPPRS